MKGRVAVLRAYGGERHEPYLPRRHLHVMTRPPALAPSPWPSPPPGARGSVAMVVVAILLACFVSSASPARAADPAPAGQMTFAVHFTLAPRWLDPAESEGSITPFLALISRTLPL